MTAALDAGKGALLVFCVAVLQVSVLTTLELGAGAPDLLLVTLVAVALVRGPLYGAGAGFFAGLVVDVATLQTLGVTSLLLTLVGYWIGRYGETTARERRHAPLLSVLVATPAFALGAFALHFMLGDGVSARVVLLEALVPTLALNLLLTRPVYAACRRLLRPVELADRAREVRLLG